jgi:MFS family permease
MIALFRRRGFALLWCAGLISMVGDRALFAALPYYVYQQTGSTLATAIMFTAYYLPPILLGSVAGVFVDRWNRGYIMVCANLMQASVLLLLLLVHSRDVVWLVYVVSAVEFSVAAFFQPAESALLPNLVETRDLVRANALASMSANLARVAGPALGGVLMALHGLPSVVLVDSASFVLAAALISMISVPHVPAKMERRDTTIAASAWVRLWREWGEGLRVVRREGLVARLFIVACITSLGGAMFDPLLAPWVSSVLHGSPAFLGWLLTATACGALGGSLLLARVGPDIPPARLNAGGNILAGLLLLVIYNLTQLPAVLVLSVAAGIPLAGSGTGLQTLLQLAVPDHVRGRVYGSLNASVALIALAGLWLAGGLGERVGIVAMLSVASGITLAAGLLAGALLPTSLRCYQE